LKYLRSQYYQETLILAAHLTGSFNVTHTRIPN